MGPEELSLSLPMNDSSMCDSVEKRMLDVIIVNYNSTDFLLKSLKSLFRTIQEVNARVIVEDNASRDGVERIPKAFPNVCVHSHNFNKGFARAANEALRVSSSPYVLLLNPDTHMSNGFLYPILDYMEKNPDVGIVGPKIVNRDGSAQGSARSDPTPLTALFGRNSMLSKWFPHNPITRRNLVGAFCEDSSPVSVDWVSGACMIIRREAFKEVGLLDERFFMYWEDADWCRRMRQHGWKVIYFPGSSVVHFVGGSSERLRIRSIYEFHKSVYRLFEKYNTRFPRLFNPLVIGTLALRLCAVMVMNGMRVAMKKNL